MDTSVNVPNRSARLGLAALCLFCSGFCALIYQTTWLREFRLTFGASTSASAAVLAIFMGGVGAGSLVLGKKVDRLANPFRFYARLEIFIALTAALTPPLLWVTRHIYVALGGTPTLGTAAGTGLRLILTALVLLAPTVLMGGTLPAAVRAVQSDEDSRRRHTALLYGANTFGAVAGAMFATFYLFEHLGNRLTLWSACALNLVVALAALQLSRRFSEHERVDNDGKARCPHRAESKPIDPARPRRAEDSAPYPFVLAAATVAGFAFFLMELVWYRMLGPLLGGSTFTFGLILAVGLLGIALGSFAFSFFRSGRPVTLAGFATISAVEALFIALPYALGDRLAVLAIVVQPLGGLGFAGRVAEWSVITSIVVLPASVLAGAQFPMLIALLGRGANAIGSDTGRTYAWNTVGAIVGSLAGGFGLLSALTAPGTWRLVVILLVALSLAAVALHLRQQKNWSKTISPALAAAFALAFLMTVGPTAAWRHSPIGTGRVTVKEASANSFRDFIQMRRRELQWEAEGRESSIGLTLGNGFSFVVNGKSDGSARGDAPTQVMVGLLGALIHSEPRDAMVVGLGTGSTAGWLADVPTMNRVDVVELEAAVQKVAVACAPVNRNALANPKLHLWFGDAREAMLTSRQQYDLIASEPSNPYRAGVASLFTHEFYEATAQRLRPGGLFVQWVQAYEVDAESIGTIYATLRSVFPVVETWRTQSSDLAFIASREPIVYDLAQMRSRIQTEPYRSALAWAWRVTDLEGVFGRYVGHRSLADAIVLNNPMPSTDDRNRLEFASARTVGRKTGFDIDVLLQASEQKRFSRPEIKNGQLDTDKVNDRRVSALVADGKTDVEANSSNAGFRDRTAAKSAHAKGHFAQAGAAWFKQAQEPGDLMEVLLVAQAHAAVGDERALPYIEKLHAYLPCEADAVLAQYWWMRQRPADAFACAEKALLAYRNDPWAHHNVIATTMDVARRVTQLKDGAPFGARLHELLAEPFAVKLLESERMVARLQTAHDQDRRLFSNLTRNAVAEFEPNVPWTEEFLRLRVKAYERAMDQRLELAQRDLKQFEASSARPLTVATREELAGAQGNPSGKSGFSLFGPTPVRAREK